MRIILLGLLTTMIICGCSDSSPIAPETIGQVIPNLSERTAADYDNHYLWGEWTFYFNEKHDQVDVVPKRQGRIHLNALKFLESYCSDCLEITNIQNNGDETIDLTVQITHPFPDSPEYTGFDVKGIIMFNGSHEVPFVAKYIWPYGFSHDPSYFHVSWAKLGDPEVLNQDGYSVLWTPYWDSGSDMPIFNYWPGKYTMGSPTSNINAFLNFYTNEERHMFSVDGQVERTYHIHLPPGPVVAGYAIDACWLPPDVMPVTNPVDDFPVSANQEEPYYFRYVVNNDEPITHEPCCGFELDCTDLRIEFSDWYGETPRHLKVSFPPPPQWYMQTDNNDSDCDCEMPPNVHYLTPYIRSITTWYPEDGNYRGVAVLNHYHLGNHDSISYDIFDYVIDLE